MTTGTQNQKLNQKALARVNEQHLDSMDINKLRKLTAKIGLSFRGNKQEIIDRIRQAKIQADQPEPKTDEQTGQTDQTDQNPSTETNTENQDENTSPTGEETNTDDQTNETETTDETETPQPHPGGRPPIQTECKFCKAPVHVKSTETVRVDEHHVRKVRRMRCTGPRSHRYTEAGERIEHREDAN